MAYTRKTFPGHIIETRFDELGYFHSTGVQIGGAGHGRRVDNWRFVDLSDSSSVAQIGPEYKSRAELLADLDRYAAEYGCKLATRPRIASPEPVPAY